jgi:hypothetical protein
VDTKTRKHMGDTNKDAMQPEPQPISAMLAGVNV